MERSDERAASRMDIEHRELPTVVHRLLQPPLFSGYFRIARVTNSSGFRFSNFLSRPVSSRELWRRRMPQKRRDLVSTFVAADETGKKCMVFHYRESVLQPGPDGSEW